MLSEREKAGVRELLQRITEEDLVPLANTVTNRLIVVQNRKEAMKAIIMYTESADQFLRRKLVRRDLLFGYLAEKYVPISPNADKSKIIRTILEHWQSSSYSYDMNAAADDSSTDTSPSSSQEFSECSRDAFSQASSGTSRNTISLSQVSTGGQKQEVTTVPSPSSLSSPVASTSATGQDWCQELAEKFSSWFFTQLNLLHPSQPAGTVSDWGPQHFHSNASLQLRAISGSEPLMDAFEGAEIVARRLGCLVTEEQLMFNPNLTGEGTRGRSDPHGLVMILTCGTIHQTNMCMGLFEQKFGLIRDPLADNNWKVKFINLQIKSGATQQTPTLAGCSDLHAITS